MQGESEPSSSPPEVLTRRTFHATHPKHVLAEGLQRIVDSCRASWGVVLNTSQGEAVRVLAGPKSSPLYGRSLDRTLLTRSDAAAFVGDLDCRIFEIPAEARDVPIVVKPPPEFLVLSNDAIGELSVLEAMCRDLGDELALCRDHFASRTLRAFAREAGNASSISDVAGELLSALRAETMRAWIPARSTDTDEVLELWWASNSDEIPQLHRVRSDTPSFTFAVLRSGNGVLIAPNTSDPAIAGELSLRIERLSGEPPRTEVIQVTTFAGGCDASLLGFRVVKDRETIAVVVFSSPKPFAFRLQRIAYVFDHLSPILATLFVRLIRDQQKRLFETLRSELSRLRHDDGPRDCVEGIANALVRAMDAPAGALFDSSGTPLAMMGNVPQDEDLTQEAKQCAATGSFLAAGRVHDGRAVRLYPFTLCRSPRSERDSVVLVTVGEVPPLVPTTAALLTRIQDLIDDHLRFVSADEHLRLGDALREAFEEARGDSERFYRAALKIACEHLLARCLLWQCDTRGAKPFFPDNEPAHEPLQRLVSESASRRTPLWQGRLMTVPIRSAGPPKWVMSCQRPDQQRPFLRVDVDGADLYGKQVLTFARAYQAVKERDEVIGTIPHELRVPIATIADNLLGIRRTPNLPSLVTDRLTTIEKVNRLNDLLITNLLHATEDGIDENLELIRLKADVLDMVVSIVKLIGIGRLPSIDVRDVRAIPEFKGKRGSLMCVFYNLFSNAVKYSDQRSPNFEITAKAEREHSGAWTVRVTDWGMGVPADWKQRIFDRGTRAPNVRDKKTGLGLGLYVSRRIVRSWGGEIALEALQGPTTFAVTFPKNLFPRG